MFDCVSYIQIDYTVRRRLDLKSKKCFFFIGYDDAKFGYCFYEDQNRKIIKSVDVIFNEKVIYKDRLSTKDKRAYPEVKKLEIIQLKDFLMNKLQDQENVTLEINPLTLVFELMRSSKNTRQLQRYSPSLYYILFANRDKPKSYEEAM